MKEIIYLDTDIVNSYLAQIDEGLIGKMAVSLGTVAQSDQENQKTNTQSSQGNLSAGVISGGGEYTETVSSKEKTVYSENNSELIETAMDDYSLDLLVEKLTEDDHLKINVSAAEDGDFILIKDKFVSYDFSRLSQTTSEENINNILQDDRIFKIDSRIRDLENKKKKGNKQHINKMIKELKDEKRIYLKENDGSENFDFVYRFGSFGSSLFPDSVLFKVGNLLAVCPKKKLRTDESTLGLFNLTQRKVNILGTIISKRENIQPSQDKNGEIVQYESNVIASRTPSILIDIMLDNFNLSTYGDYFIRPIAIYFDWLMTVFFLPFYFELSVF